MSTISVLPPLGVSRQVTIQIPSFHDTRMAVLRHTFKVGLPLVHWFWNTFLAAKMVIVITRIILPRGHPAGQSANVKYLLVGDQRYGGKWEKGLDTLVSDRT
jgi:hypothetical protein